ncbi:acyl carrier protein [Streptomyces sp. NPDC006422]|uniref:acyl carrier protein n=1 Tax=unclassified Streptomyces TaxID=2593676 RepID=UPI0033AAC197
MSRTTSAKRTAAVAALLLAAGALSAPAATAQGADAAPGDAYVLHVTTNPTSTDYDDRRVDVTGTVTKADGTPAPNIPVTVKEVVRFTTWNPWGDPIDPNYYEPRELGTPVSDAEGKFTIPNVNIDHVGASSLLNVESEVEISATYDEDGDPDTPQDGYFADTTVGVERRTSTVSYQVNKRKVKAGDILTVQGRVTTPQGVDPYDTEVFLQTYWESQVDVRTTTEHDGFFVMSVRVDKDDDTFVLRTAPRDLYVAGAQKTLPVSNASAVAG